MFMNNKGIFSLIILALIFIFALVNKHRKVNIKNQLEKIEQTFAIIKPDAVKAENSDKIIDLIKANGFTITNMKKLNLTKEQAQQFYAVHKDRPFFNDLVEFMTSGPSIIMVLEKDNAVTDWRNLMGATDPSKAAPNTVRKLYGTNITQNATHGSDSVENAQKEIALTKSWL